MKLGIVILFISIVVQTHADEDKMPMNNDFINFENIKGVLKKDRLEQTLKEKREADLKRKKAKEIKKKKLYSLPSRNDFWKIMIEYWLVKNITILKWDFRKPDYGVGDYFTNFLRQVGEIGLTYKILYLNTPSITHFAFPVGHNEYLFVLSVPFIRSLDLSKLEISILLFEDMLRVKNEYFANAFDDKMIAKLTEGNFYKQEFPKKEIAKILEEIDKKVFEKGFNFQEQHQVTKSMNNILISDKQYWQAYYGLLGKIDQLVKNNLMYKNYVKIYPSPELQMNWLNPTKN